MVEHYQLQSDEVILYEGEVTKTDKYPKESLKSAFSVTPSSELILTNKNLVLTTRSKKLFSKEEVTIDVYPMDEVKIYNDTPQIKQSKVSTEIYMTSGELYFDFNSKIEAAKFFQAAVQLLTGKTLAKRSAEKVKGGIELVDDTLGINTVDSVKGVLENGLMGTLFSGFKKGKPSAGKTISKAKDASEIAKAMLNAAPQKNVEHTQSYTYDQQIDALNKLKALLDAGVLTQEEFEAKKKEILNL